MSLLFTLNMFYPCPSVSIVNFEHVIAGWEVTLDTLFLQYHMLKRKDKYIECRNLVLKFVNERIK